MQLTIEKSGILDIDFSNTFEYENPLYNLIKQRDTQYFHIYYTKIQNDKKKYRGIKGKFSISINS